MRLQICSYLNAKDLLNLSNSCRLIRVNLVGPAAVALWRQARLRVGLPDLEAGVMSELMYANLFALMKCQVSFPFGERDKGGVSHAPVHPGVPQERSGAEV